MSTVAVINSSALPTSSSPTEFLVHFHYFFPLNFAIHARVGSGSATAAAAAAEAAELSESPNHHHHHLNCTASLTSSSSSQVAAAAVNMPALN